MNLDMLPTSEPITAETLRTMFDRMYRAVALPPQYLVTPQTWRRFEEMRANPRLDHYDSSTLLAYAEVGATPRLRTASYALGKSYRRATRRARRKARSQR